MNCTSGTKQARLLNGLLTNLQDNFATDVTALTEHIGLLVSASGSTVDLESPPAAT